MKQTKIAPLYSKIEDYLLEKKIHLFEDILKSCILCPRECKVNRLAGKKGFCGATEEVVVYSFFPHFGEEVCLVGSFGSGTIFFSHCNLKCVFCQNFEISHLSQGQKVTVQELAEIMLKLQNMGCHNINLVTPTHFLPQILKALRFAREKNLRLPLVYNCSGYESEEIINLLEDIIDIYMPDIKFFSAEKAKRYLQAENYFEVVKRVLKIMHKQVGELKIIEGIARRGLLIRHLVMPENLEDTYQILKFIAEEISPNTFINIMGQYRPCGLAFKYPEINRHLTFAEYKKALDFAKRLGLRNIL